MTDLTRIEDLVRLRKAHWHGDVAADTALVARIARRIVRDPAMRAEVRRRPWLLIEAVMQVTDKGQQIVPFFLNRVQSEFLALFELHGTERPYFILKGRQQGFTTLITAMQLAYCLSRRQFAGFTLADTPDNMNAIFTDKAKALYERLPAAVKPRAKYNSRRELLFGATGSSWRVGAAGDNLGRSRTLHFVHYSEVAFYKCRPEALQRSIGEALTAGSVQIYETTANGWNGVKDLWDGGHCVNVFVPWWHTDEYVYPFPPDPADVDAWLKARLEWLREQGVDEGHRRWYAAKYRAYLDKNSIMQEYPCTPDEAWISTGDCFFDRDAVLSALARTPTTPIGHVGYFDCRMATGEEERPVDIRWVEDPHGPVVLHAPPRTRLVDGRRELAPYALGGDTAGEGSDWYAAKVVDASTMRTVATLHVQHTDDDLYARQIYALGTYYHTAMVGLEVNYSMAPTVLLTRWGYPNLYMRTRFDGQTGATGLRAGFYTNARTRPIILANLKALWREDPTIECDRATLLEMLGFVRNGLGRPEAARGKHDDLVMSLAIAHRVAEACGREWLEEAAPDEDWISRHFHCE